MSDITAEAMRQQQFVQALWAGTTPVGLRASDDVARGLAAYRAHAAALAQRALAAVFPTVQQVVGADAFAVLSRLHWQSHPPTEGDMAQWGDALPQFLADDVALKDEPYLPDLARLEWAVHVADRAGDGPSEAAGLALLAEHDPQQLFVQLAAGTAVVASCYPVVRVWHAHRSDEADVDRFAVVRAAFAAGDADCALVWRQGWRVQVHTIAPAELRFTQALLAGHSLGLALTEAGDDFAFEPWLIGAVQQQRLWAVTLMNPTQRPAACSTAPPSPR
jgi:Putative DNA-binding domain